MDGGANRRNNAFQISPGRRDTSCKGQKSFQETHDQLIVGTFLQAYITEKTSFKMCL